MRITATRGTHAVTIEIDGATTELLRAAEATALALLGNSDPPRKPPLGFAAPVTREKHDDPVLP